jgi:hypothetical protein
VHRRLCLRFTCSAGWADYFASFLSPLWGSLAVGFFPTACAVGFILTPLRGFSCGSGSRLFVCSLASKIATGWFCPRCGFALGGEGGTPSRPLAGRLCYLARYLLFVTFFSRDTIPA